MSYLDRNDMSEEQFQRIAYFDIHEHVIGDSEELYYYSQRQNEVVIESKRNKCIFRKHGDQYKLQYLETDGIVCIMHGDREENSNTSQIIFQKKVGKRLYFTHFDPTYDKQVNVVVTTC
jgi:hypothetical protein